MIIRIISPEGGKDEFEFDTEVVIIGRGQNCDIVLADDHISRKHLEIKNLGGIAYIKDLTLANWVSYNDEKLPKELDVQYYDFAPLVLPGNYRVEIELGETDATSTQQKIDLFKDKIKTHSMAVNTTSASLAQFDDSDVNPIEIDKKKKKSNRTTKKKVAEKSRNEFLIITLVTLGAVAFVINEVLLQKNTNVSVTPPVIKKIQKVKNVQEVKKVVATPKETITNQIQNVQEGGNPLFKLLTTGVKCQTALEKVMCKYLFPNSARYEGTIERDKELILFKNFAQRGVLMMGNPGALAQFEGKEKDFVKIVAGESILSPNILQKLENNQKTSVKIIVFKETVSGAVIMNSFLVDVTDYRKYDKTTYDKAYEAIKKSDLSIFNANLARFLKEI